MTKQTGWWYRASKEQRLEQIRAGIELGMTSKQVAMNCGCYLEQAYGSHGSDQGGQEVANFALNNGAPFPRVRKSAAIERANVVRSVHAEARRAHDQTDVSEAFDIFGVRSSRNEFTSIFETAEA